MAKKKKKRSFKKSVATRYVAAKRAVKRARKAGGASVGKKDAITMLAGGAGGAVAGSLIISKIPLANNNVKAGIVAGAGALALIFGFKKKNKILIGAGLGMAATATAKLVQNNVAALAGDDFTLDEQQAANELLGAAVDGDYDGDDDDEIGAAIDGDYDGDDDDDENEIGDDYYNDEVGASIAGDYV